MKGLTALKAAVLLSAAVTLVLRIVCFRYGDTLAPEALRLLRTISIAAAAALLISGVLWAVLEKKRTKAAPDGAPDADKKENAR